MYLLYPSILYSTTRNLITIVFMIPGMHSDDTRGGGACAR